MTLSAGKMSDWDFICRDVCNKGLGELTFTEGTKRENGSDTIRLIESRADLGKI